jgi:three-Cys-motif partner protein
MDAFWGGATWREAAYSTQGNLFGLEEKQGNDQIAHAFRERLESAAGFRHVLEPLPMRNSRGAIVYYLFFASQKPVAEKIVRDIFAKYRNRGLGHGNKDSH